MAYGLWPEHTNTLHWKIKKTEKRRGNWKSENWFLGFLGNWNKIFKVRNRIGIQIQIVNSNCEFQRGSFQSFCFGKMPYQNHNWADMYLLLIFSCCCCSCCWFWFWFWCMISHFSFLFETGTRLLPEEFKFNPVCECTYSCHFHSSFPLYYMIFLDIL